MEVDRLADDRQNQIEMQHAHQAHSSPLLGVVGAGFPFRTSGTCHTEPTQYTVYDTC